jgi:hypothetical protein
MDKNGAQHLSEALFENHGVKVISLGSNPIGSEGAQAIANAIRANSTLTRIEYVRFATAVGEAWRLPLTDVMVLCSLSNTDIEEDGLVSIMDALQITLSLQSIAYVP